MGNSLAINSTLLSLDLSWNEFGYDGGMNLKAGLIVNSSVTQLDIIFRSGLDSEMLAPLLERNNHNLHLKSVLLFYAGAMRSICRR